jgi:hypothetical protein
MSEVQNDFAMKKQPNIKRRFCMRKIMLVSLMVALLLSALGISAVAAQDKTPIEFGQWVEGTLTADEYELKYSFSGTAGQIVLLEMIPKPGTYDLDPMVVLRNSDGDILGQNDDFSYPLSVVVAELPSDGDYTVLATRSGGKGGSSEGAYWLRATNAEPLAAGAKMEVTLTSDSEKETPNVYVLHPDADGPIKVGFSQEIGDLYASVDIASWVDDSYPTSIMSLSDTSKVSAATFSVELEAGEFYIMTVKRAFGSFVFDTTEATVTITIN